jgi:hypothetical protein
VDRTLSCVRCFGSTADKKVCNPEHCRQERSAIRGERCGSDTLLCPVFSEPLQTRKSAIRCTGRQESLQSGALQTRSLQSGAAVDRNTFLCPVFSEPLQTRKSAIRGERCGSDTFLCPVFSEPLQTRKSAIRCTADKKVCNPEHCRQESRNPESSVDRTLSVSGVFKATADKKVCNPVRCRQKVCNPEHCRQESLQSGALQTRKSAIRGERCWIGHFLVSGVFKATADKKVCNPKLCRQESLQSALQDKKVCNHTLRCAG